MVDGLQISQVKDFSCEACSIGKAHRIFFPKITQRRKTDPGEFFHFDISGPQATPSLGGARYIVTFKDDTSSYRFVNSLKHKSDFYDRFAEIEQLINNKFNRLMKSLRSDNGKEYKSNNHGKCKDHDGNGESATVCMGRSSKHCSLRAK